MKSVKIKPLDCPVNTSVFIPGSKSYTNRALIMAVLTKNAVKIKNFLKSDDTDAMISCLREFGINIQVNKNDLIVFDNIENENNKKHNVNARLSGTTIRFITALACCLKNETILSGEDGLCKRPIKELILGLCQIGGKIQYLNEENFPPLHIIPSKINENAIITMNGDISSQYFSALMMIAPLFGITINVDGNQISKSYIDMTIDMMGDWGVNVRNDNYKSYFIPSCKYDMNEYIVEGDYSGAGYFFAIGTLTKSKITLNNLNPKSKQGDAFFIDILERMGNKFIKNENSVTIIGNGVVPISIDMENCPDQVQTLAVLSAFANGKTTITGIRSLRLKETERVVAIEKELEKMHIKTESTYDTIIIYGGNPKSAKISTYGDHRMAMSFAVAGTLLDDMIIENYDVVNKTFPKFWDILGTIVHLDYLDDNCN